MQIQTSLFVKNEDVILDSNSKISRIQAFIITEVFLHLANPDFCDWTDLASVLIFLQCDVTLETEGWCRNSRNCPLSMQYTVPFCGYKLVGYGTHRF